MPEIITICGDYPVTMMLDYFPELDGVVILAKEYSGDIPCGWTPSASYIACTTTHCISCNECKAHVRYHKAFAIEILHEFSTRRADYDDHPF